MASTGDGYPEQGSEAPAKVKKPRPLPPPPPPAVATASLLIRGAAARVLGLNPGKSGGELQPIWVTEPGCSKVTITFDASARSPFPKEDDHPALINAVEEETNRLASAGGAIAVFEIENKAAAEAKYGQGICVNAEPVRLAHLPGAALVEIPQNWTLCGRLEACGKISFLVKEVEEGSKKKPDTMILAKKKQLFVKFQVEHRDAPAAEASGEAPSADAVKGVLDSSVRVSVEGVDVNKAAKVEAKAEAGEAAEPEGEMVVDPWSVKGKIDYTKLIREFGSSPISEELKERMLKLLKKKGKIVDLHRWIRRNIFFSHRELEAIIALQEKEQPFYLYTGRGPTSAAMHMGHLLPFMFTQWLQEAFDVPLVVQMTDDEKFLWKGEYDPDKADDTKTGDNLDWYRYLTVENAKDIIACGFDKNKTFIFSDCDYVGHMYPNIVRTWKAITYSTAKGAFGFTPESNVGQSAFPAIQAVPSFSSSFRIPLKGNDNMACLIPCAIDQDPYFRVTRDIAHKLVGKNHPLKGKPSLIHCKFFPPLQGAEGKMSASDSNSAVYLTDTPEEIERKIREHAFSGGRQTAKEQREKGANLHLDVSFQWLTFFLEDDELLKKIEAEYGSGTGDYWNTSAVKEKLIEVLKVLIAKHQEKRKKVSDDMVKEWMAVRELKF